MRVRARLLAFLSLLTLAALAWSTAGAAASSLFPEGGTGYDRSWPECSAPAPESPFAFAIIGATGGRAFTHNPCLADEYRQGALGSHLQPALYMNLKSPVGANAGEALSGPRGNCAATDTACQAYNFGYKTALDAVTYAASQHAVATSWWLDVETASSWSTDTATNALVIGGALDYLRARGFAVGIYSSQGQWTQIAGDYKPGVPVWVSTAPDATSAPAYCARAFGGGTVAVVQYFTAQGDLDYACTPADRATVVASTPLGPAGSTAVVATPGDCLHVRPSPAFVSSPTTCLADGTTVTLLDGSAVADGYEWRLVSAGDARGWVADTYLRPPGSMAGATPSGAAPATLTTPPTAHGVNASAWTGGSVAQLLTQAPHAISVWVFHAGQPVGYIVGAPTYANAAFTSLFAGSIVPPGSIVFVVMP